MFFAESRLIPVRKKLYPFFLLLREMVSDLNESSMLNRHNFIMILLIRGIPKYTGGSRK
jgi:hypothetical protein